MRKEEQISCVKEKGIRNNRDKEGRERVKGMNRKEEKWGRYEEDTGKKK